MNQTLFFKYLENRGLIAKEITEEEIIQNKQRYDSFSQSLQDVAAMAFVIVSFIYMIAYIKSKLVELAVRTSSDEESKWELIEPENGIPLDQFTIKYCERKQKYLTTIEESGLVFHREWNRYEDEMRCVLCVTCSKELNKEPPPAYSTISIV